MGYTLNPDHTHTHTPQRLTWLQSVSSQPSRCPPACLSWWKQWHRGGSAGPSAGAPSPRRASAGDSSRKVSGEPRLASPRYSSFLRTRLPAGEPAWPGTDRAPAFSPPSPSPACYQPARPAEDPWRKKYNIFMVMNARLERSFTNFVFVLLDFFTAAMQTGQKSNSFCWWINRLLYSWLSLTQSANRFYPQQLALSCYENRVINGGICLWSYIVPLSI